MKKITLYHKLSRSVIMALLSVFFMGSLALADHDEYSGTLVRAPRGDLDINVWTDQGSNAIYHPGDDIRIYFRTNHDAFVVIYNVDTRGYVHLLYPYNYRDSRFVQGRRTYSIPSSRDDYDLLVDGPSGTEQIVAIASWDPFDLPNLGWDSEDGEKGDYDYENEDEYGPGTGYYLRRDDNEDEEEFIDRLNSRIIPRDYDDYSVDVTYFRVKYRHPRSYYTYPGYYGYPYYYDSFGACYFDYPFGAAIYIDGFFFGYTPLFLPYFIVGRHYVYVIYHHNVVYRDYFHVYPKQKVVFNISPYKKFKFYNDRFSPKDYRRWSDKIVVKKEIQPLRVDELKKLDQNKAYKQNLKHWQKDTGVGRVKERSSPGIGTDDRPGKRVIDYPDEVQNKNRKFIKRNDNSDGSDVEIQKETKRNAGDDVSNGKIQKRERNSEDEGEDFKPQKREEKGKDQPDIEKQERKKPHTEFYRAPKYNDRSGSGNSYRVQGSRENSRTTGRGFSVPKSSPGSRGGNKGKH